MRILENARRLESTLSRSLDQAARRLATPAARQPLETMHAIVDAVAMRLEPAGRGRFVFPFNRIAISIAAATRSEQSRFAAVFAESPSLDERIEERLRAAGCDAPAVRVHTTFVECAQPTWLEPEFAIEFDRVADEEPAVEEAVAEAEHLKLTVVGGTAEKPAYTFSPGAINLGRCADVRDSRHRLLRTNHVAFTDAATDTNHTVSRRHAHIAYSAATRDYRVHDDGSTHGTSVVRHGKTIAVPSGVRGVRLQSGDEIVLGDARLRVRIVRA
jgi:hypothetical protein